MGGGSYSADDMTSRVQTAKTLGKSLFVHQAAVQSGAVAAAVHASLDVKIANKAGIRIRESLDNDEHPESEAFVVAFDVTGSMGHIPTVMVEKLPALMGMLLKKGISEHPQIMFAAVGDAQGHTPGSRGDNFPLQVGQFESGNQMDDAFTNIILEGNGQGQGFESYDLMMYYLARHTKLDCYDKRGVKAILFLIGDERVREVVRRDEVLRVIGDTLEADIPIQDILNELKQRYEVFFINPRAESYSNATYIQALKELFQERLVFLDDPDAMCETIAALIAAERGLDLDAIQQHLRDAGAADNHVTSATTALAGYTGSSTHLSMRAAQVDGDTSLLDDDADVDADAPVALLK